MARKIIATHIPLLLADPELSEEIKSCCLLKIPRLTTCLVQMMSVNPNPSLSKRSKSEVKHKVMHHYILKAAALKEKGRPSRLKTE